MPRKGRFGFDPGNTAPDGDYVVGKGRPPEHGKFRKGDGRKRGRRPKGTKNLAHDLREELESAVTVTVGGVPKTVSRQRAILMRLADNATKGQTSAIALTLDAQQRLVGPLLEREEQAKKENTNRDFSRLSDAELSILMYFLAKLEGSYDEYNEIIGVIPIYKDGQYLGDEAHKAIEVGLKPYGIQIDRTRNFPPKCRPD